MELGVGGCLGPCLAMSGFSLCTQEGPPHHAAGLAGVLGRLRWAAILRGAPIWGGGGRSREARCAHGTEGLEAWLVVWGEKGWGLGAGWVVLGGSRGLGRSQDAFGDLAGSGLSQGGPCW